MFYNPVMTACVLTSWCVYSEGQSKLQACGEVWKCVPIMSVWAITGTSLSAALQC